MEGWWSPGCGYTLTVRCVLSPRLGVCVCGSQCQSLQLNVEESCGGGKSYRGSWAGSELESKQLARSGSL